MGCVQGSHKLVLRVMREEVFFSGNPAQDIGGGQV
jgi:hypothetical protein